MPRISLGGTRELTITAAAEISGQHVYVKTSGYLLDVTCSGSVVKISGETVRISGQPVSVSGNIVIISGQPVSVSGNIVIISGQPVSVSGNIVIISGQSIKISGETVRISGQPVSVSGNIIDIVVPSVVKTGNLITVTGSGAVLSDVPAISVLLKALSKNSGDIYIGGINTYIANSGFGLQLSPGEAVNIDISNLNKLSAFAICSGDKLSFLVNA